MSLQEKKIEILNEIKKGESFKLLNEKINDNIHCSCHNQIHILYDLRNLIKKEKCVYVEIGSWLGDSACLLLRNNNKTELYCIDLFEYNTNYKYFYKELEKIKPNERKTQEELLKNRLIKHNVNNYNFNIIKGRSDSSNIIKKISQLKIDILFIDGSHLFQNVINDFKNYEKFVEKGGFIVFDDYQDLKYCPEVKKAVDFILNNMDLSEYLIIGSLERQFDYDNWASKNSKYSTEFILYKKL